MSRLTANLSMTNELAEEYRELKRNLIPILLQTCGKERLCDAVDKWLLVKSGIKVISKSWYEGGLPGKEYVVQYLLAIPLKVLIMNIVLRGIEPTLRHLTM